MNLRLAEADRERWGKTGEPRVSYGEAKARVLRQAKPGSTFYANTVGRWVWPKGRMKSQGYAFAVGPFLRRMIQEGVIRVNYNDDGSGPYRRPIL